jgi:hypothetical protein
MRLELHITPSGSTYQVRTVDRRAEYQAKVRNQELHLQRDFRAREMRGRSIKAWLFDKELRAIENLAIASALGLNWSPQLPRPDAPPSARHCA